jgi:hypothetical protein
MWKFSRGGVILVTMLLIGSMTSPLIDAPRADRGLLFPTTSPFFAVDQEGMHYLQSVDEDAVILNEWWTATGSAWIPSLIRRKVIFPYIFSLEHYVNVLEIPQREREAFIVAAFPNSREAHTSLQEWDVDYIFLSSYVLDEAKWRNALWNPFLLKESPHYSLEFEKKYTYIFAVSPSNEYTTRISFTEYEFFISPGDTGIIDQLDFEMSFPVDTILELSFKDQGWTDIRVETEHGLLALVPRLNTGKEIHVAFRIPPETERVTISVEEVPIPVRAVLSTSVWDVLSYSDQIFMVGDNWEITDETYRLSDQGHIYLLHTTDTVQLTYIDTGEGNIDFNLYRNGEWEKITTIYRENDGLEKTVVLDIPPGFTLLDIGINIWGDPLLLSRLTCS